MSRWSLESEPATWARRAIARADATESPLSSPAYLHAAFADFLAGDHAAALDANREAMRRRPTPSDRGWARHYAAVELLYLGRTAEAAAMADDMVADQPPRPVERAMQSSAHAVYQVYAGRSTSDDALPAIERAADVARTTGSPVALGHVTYNRGLVAYTKGDVDIARAAFEEAREIGREHRIANLIGYVLVSQVYAPGYSGLVAAREALDYWRTRSDVGNEFVVLEATAINLAELRRFEPAAVILGNLDRDPRRLASSYARRQAAMGEIALSRRSEEWLERGARMSRREVLEFTHDAIEAALATL